MKFLRTILLGLILGTSVLCATNINTASKTSLMKLEGIDSKKADNIIKYRQKTKFNVIEDIKKVDGIGTATFNKIKSEIIVENKTIGDSLSNNKLLNTKDNVDNTVSTTKDMAAKTPEEILQEQAKKQAMEQAKQTTVGKTVTKVNNAVENIKEEVFVSPEDRAKSLLGN